MGNVMDAEERAEDRSGTTTLILSNSEHQNPTAEQSQHKRTFLDGLPLYLVRKDKGVVEPLNVPARNALAHESPALVKNAVTAALQRHANKKGSFHSTGCVIHWKQSAIPFLIEFEISASDDTCQHLASVRQIPGKDPDQYARNLLPLAKHFLSKPPGSDLPHLPFTRPQIPSDNESNRNTKDKQTTKTIQHACFINDQYKCLNEIDIKTAEATAKMINAGKILSGLLGYLTTPKPRVEGAVMSIKLPKEEGKGLRPTERPSSATLKQPKAASSTSGAQDHEPSLKHKRVAPRIENDIDGVKVTTKPTLEESSARNDISVVEEILPDEPAVAIKSSEEKKESKKHNQGRKQALNERTKSKDTFTVTAYPTQRPPRQKRVRKTFITRQPLPEERLVPENSDLEQVSAIEPSIREAPDNEHHVKDTPEPQLISEEVSQQIGSSESSSEDYESETSEAEEELIPGLVSPEIAFSPCNNVQGEDFAINAGKPTALPPPRKRIQQYGGGAQGLLWAYTFNAEVDDILDDARIWLWREPSTYFRAQPLLRSVTAAYSVLVPAVVSHGRVEGDEPIIEFDGDTVHIVPHEQCWEDVRAHESHPDFLVPRKLAEYQACEAAGYHVWRHDRDLLKCRKTGCEAMISDYHRSTVICLGCGPKSIVRYCSLRHQLDDIGGHWQECGTWRVLVRQVIDHSTAPSKFARMYPAIKQRHGSNTAALHRQKLYCALTNGHYTLFDSDSTSFETLYWSKQDPKWPEMDRRVERLLNIAFLDSWNHQVLGYLYRLLRELLRSRGEWSETTERCLRYQFESEFSDYQVNPNWNNGDSPCQCEWSGKMLPGWDHLTTCYAYAPEADDWGLVWRRRCVEAIVEDYEERFWILRAWRQQHPTQNNWRLRAAGHSFPSITPDEECYKLGPGWTGWGGETDNIREDQRNRGESSMRSV